MGDNAYPYGSTANFRNCYAPTWGDYKKRTKPSLGNHEYYDENYDSTTAAGPYFDYFGARAGARGKGYYSYDRGSWHIVVLNSNCEKVGGCESDSPQGRWLRKDKPTRPSYRLTTTLLRHFYQRIGGLLVYLRMRANRGSFPFIEFYLQISTL